MSVFERIDPQHPLNEAARITNAYAEEQGLEATLEWLGMDIDAGRLAYLGEQRALRAIAATMGVNLSGNTEADRLLVRRIQQTPLWQDMRMLLISCYMDGLTIGWKGHQLATQETGE